jgi:hypothetical protein
VEKYLCKLCKKSFKAKNKAKIHYENFHKKKDSKKAGAFKCQFNLCSDAFENKEDRKMHHMVRIVEGFLGILGDSTGILEDFTGILEDLSGNFKTFERSRRFP